MTHTWATSGVDLHLELAPTRPRASIESALREAVRSGRLQPGSRLPSSRTLAVDLGVARNTVTEAYGQLVAEGWLTSAQGSGTWVSARGGRALDDRRSDPAPKPQLAYDLSPGTPDVSAFPRAGWLVAARGAVTDASSSAFGYADPQGRPELRQALAEYLARVRGVRVSADTVMICSGFTQGLAMLGRVLVERGHTRSAVESHGLPVHRDVIGASGLEPVPIEVDSGGARTDRLVELDDVRAVLLTPAHQYPLGSVLAPERRTQAVAWASEVEGVVVEDDYDGEFRYDRHPVGSMQSLAPDRVVYAGTASKTLAPGLRLGWLVLPPGLLKDVVDVKVHFDTQSTLDQLTLARFIGGGAYDRHVRRTRLVYRRRRDRLVSAVAELVPGARVAGIAAGLHLLLELPDGVDEADVVTRAAGRGLHLQGLGDYAARPDTHRPALVVGYAAPAEHAFTEALARLITTLVESVPA